MRNERLTFQDYDSLISSWVPVNSQEIKPELDTGLVNYFLTTLRKRQTLRGLGEPE